MIPTDPPVATAMPRPAFVWAATALVALPALHLAPIDFDRGAALLFAPFVFLGLRSKASPGPVPARMDRTCLWILAAVVLLSTALSPHWAPSLALVAAWLWTLAIPATLHRLRPNSSEASLLLLGVAGGGLLGMALVSAKVFFAQGPTTTFPVYGNPRLMGLHLLCGALATMILLCHRGATRGERLATCALAVTLWAALFWTGGRAPVLGLAAGGAACLWADAPASRGRRAGHLVLLAAIAFLVSLAIPPLGAAAGLQGAWERSSAATSLDSISSGRLDFWKVTLENALESPWLGHGADAYNFLRPRQDGNQPHNFLLQWFQDFGLFGAAALSLLIARAWWRGLGKARTGAGNDFPARSGWVGLGALGITGLLDGVFYHAIALLPLVFFAGLIPFSAGGQDEVAANTRVARRAPWGLGAAALILIVHQFLFVRLLAPPPESPRAPAARLLRAFPSTTNALWRWLEAWKTREPREALEWARWATHHSHAPAIYHAFIGKMAVERGDLATAEAAYREALATTHHTSRAHFARLLKLIEQARAEPAPATAGS